MGLPQEKTPTHIARLGMYDYSLFEEILSTKTGHKKSSPKRQCQNILFVCYNDKLSAEQISLEIGVSLPYMEDKLAELCEYELLKKDGNRNYTNIVIFTRDFSKEVNNKTTRLREKIADMLTDAVTKYEKDVRVIFFWS